jgi:CRP-like cAMP-binding protein
MKYPEVYDFFNSIVELPEEEWLIVEENIVKKSVKKGTMFLRPGDNASTFNLVLKGLLRLFYMDQNGNEYTKTFIRKNEIASPYAEMLQAIDSKVNIEALEDCEVIQFEYAFFKSLFDRHHCWNTLARKFSEKYFCLKEKKEYELLLLSAKERYDLFTVEFADLLDKIPQYQIASYLGITPVSLSRLLKNSKK